MFKLIILISSSIGTILCIKSIVELKSESLKNKYLFINEFRNSELNNHPYMLKNYNLIKKNIEDEYKILNYLEKEDREYTKCLYQEDKSSYRYSLSLLTKYDIKKVKQEVEFDVLRECFMHIYKNEEEYQNGKFLVKNKKLILCFTHSLMFNKKIVNSYKFLFASSILFIYSLFIIL